MALKDHTVRIVLEDEDGNVVHTAEVSGNTTIRMLVMAATVNLFRRLADVGYGTDRAPDHLPEDWT